MKIVHTLLFAALAAALAGCHSDTPDTRAARNGEPSATESTLGDSVGKAMGEAQRKLETETITLRTDEGGTHKAEISPAGDLTIDGRSIPLTQEQRALVLEHRAQMVRLARAGMSRRRRPSRRHVRRAPRPVRATP